MTRQVFDRPDHRLNNASNSDELRNLYLPTCARGLVLSRFLHSTATFYGEREALTKRRRLFQGSCAIRAANAFFQFLNDQTQAMKMSLVGPAKMRALQGNSLLRC